MTRRTGKILKLLLKACLFVLLVVLGIGISLLLWFGYEIGDYNIIPEYAKISGFPGEEKTYLVVFQNNNEIRPAGGFITAYGLMKFNHGLFQDLQINNVYGTTDQHSYIEPPYPLNTMLDKDGQKLSYSFRDANFAPDFRYSAKNLEKMLKLTQKDLQVDGVIAINYSFLEDLLGKIGGVDVDRTKLDKNSLFSTLEYSVNDIDRHSLTDLANRKDILKDFSKELIKKIVLHPLMIGDVLKVAHQSLDKKDIQIYFKDESLEKMAITRGWSGSWEEKTNSDLLALNTANLGGLKADRYISKNISYDLHIDKKSQKDDYKLSATTKITLKYFGTENIPVSGDYNGFLRLYVPEGANLTSSDKNSIEDFSEHDEGYLHVYECFIKMKPGEEKSFSYTYYLPSSLIKDDKYSLFIPKQSGAVNDSYTVVITLPNDYSLSSDTFQTKENFALYNGRPDNNMSFNLSFKKGDRPPYAIYQNIDSLSKIKITFNKDVSPLEDSNFQIEDSNEKVPGSTDTIKILDVQQTGPNVWLNVGGMTYQNEERYNILLKGVKDLDGNTINPDPRKITVVQRVPQN
ncbi:MAG: DUF4012 domain-containing protein [Candidatus Peregrinibacteria bacterium]|nr:DUF4012 domain-containing protein [Candidatus Peregrinibacteria bacterium]